MEENTTMQEVQENVTGTPESSSDPLDSAFDSGFDDDGPKFDVDDDWGEDTEAQDGTGTEGETDQSSDEANEGGDDGEGTSSEPETAEGAEESQRVQDQNDSFTLRHLGEDRTVNREEVVALAQKGMDYDRIREKWDGIKDDVGRLRSYESFLKELADARGGDIDSLMDETRTRTLMARAEAKGEKLDASAAAAQAVRMRLNSVPQQQATEQTPAPEENQQAVNDMIDRFIQSEYGHSVKAEDIPKEVWDKAAETKDLVGAYRDFENRNLKEEMKKLQKELETAKQQQKNKQRSAGSSKSEGSGRAKDPFLEGWDYMK